MKVFKKSTTDLDPGMIEFLDNYTMPDDFTAGNYTITVSQTLSSGENTINTQPLTSSQQFIISGPQFSIDTSQIMNMYPPAGSTGIYGEVLPHIVLKDPMMAWERSMSVDKTPWIALMVFQENELVMGDNKTTHAFNSTVNQFLALTSSTLLAPTPIKEADIEGTAPCQYIQMSVQTFQTNFPYLTELPFLSHVRKVNTGGKSMDGINEDGIFSVTTSNRFASAPNKNGQPLKNIVHLVSLEGMDNYLTPGANFGNYTNVALVSLASWVFYSLPDISQNFKQLAQNLVNSEGVLPSINPSLLWLQMPTPTKGSGAAMTELTNRITNGFVPLPYHTRSGEDTFAWYRGPLTPVLPALITKPSPFFTSDSALIYDNTNGVFDVSLATAWETGREAALADSGFIQKMVDFRHKANSITDSLLYKLNSDHFSQTDIESLEATTTVQQNVLSLLTPQLIADIGASAEANYPAPPAPPAPSTTNIVQDTQAFLGTQAVQNKIADLLSTDLVPISEWLAQLMLLYPVPFDNIVSNAAMLPDESIRFFYVDQNWLQAAVDGALSIGLDSSRQTFFSQVTSGLIFSSAMQALAVTRDKLLKIPVTPDPAPPTTMSGFLLRSAIVKGWPNLVVKASATSDAPLNILRMDHLSDNVLLCILDGVPQTIDFSEPHESLGFGVSGNGEIAIRDVADAANLGKELKYLQIRDLVNSPPNQMCMRSNANDVLNINPSDPKGLIATLTQNVTLPQGADLGSSIFAIQMIKSAEGFIFTSSTT